MKKLSTWWILNEKYLWKILLKNKMSCHLKFQISKIPFIIITWSYNLQTNDAWCFLATNVLKILSQSYCVPQHTGLRIIFKSIQVNQDIYIAFCFSCTQAEQYRDQRIMPQLFHYIMQSCILYYKNIWLKIFAGYGSILNTISEKK